MNKEKQEAKDKLQWLLRILVLGAVLVNIKSILVDFDIDPEYAVAMSYRMLQGDKMFLQMWEPHQTSAFLCTFLMWIYHGITGTYTGVVLFLQCMGVLIQGGIALLLYFFFRKRVDEPTAILIAAFFFVVRPKDIVFPEYSNMQIWFSVLLFMCLIKYLENQKRFWLLLGSLCLCLEIISYPTCLITCFAVILLLVTYSGQKGKDIFFFLLCCGVQGIAYVGFFVLRIGVDRFITSLQRIVSGDQSHDGITLFQGGISIEYFIKGCLWLVVGVLFAVLTEWVLERFEKRFPKWFSIGKPARIVFLYGSYLLLTDVIAIFVLRERQMYNILFLLMICAALYALRYCQKEERRLVLAGMLISGCSFLGTALITNLGFVETVKYLVLAVSVSMVALPKWIGYCAPRASGNLPKILLLAFVAVIMVHRGYQIKTIGSLEYSVLELRDMISEGPEKGIFTGYMGAQMERATQQDWKEYVRPGDRVLLASSNSVRYLYEDVTVSTKSTICTPTFDELQQVYWDENPDHIPNVVVVECWYGDLREDENSWIMQWIQKDPRPVTYADGSYWRFYRLGE